MSRFQPLLPQARRVVTLDDLTYSWNPVWWLRQAALAGARLTVHRGRGRGFSQQDPDGSYAHVCTRTDLAGPSAW